MNFEYNGVELELLQLDRVDREAVYSTDGQDLLYIKWVIGATCVYAPGGYPVGTAASSISPATVRELTGKSAQPRNLRGVNPTVPPFSQTSNSAGQWRKPSYDAFITDAELKARLYVPRRKLRLWVWDRAGNRAIWLESPKPGLICDLAGGPKPISVDVVSSTGEGQNFGVHMQIMTHLSPCPDGSDRLILSHRWEMDHSEDEDRYLTRTIRGEVVFNQALLESNNFNPDWLRNQFLHPIPLGMKRGPLDITRSSDGTTIRYVLSDIDTSITFDAGDSGATEIEIIENVSYTQPWNID